MIKIIPFHKHNEFKRGGHIKIKNCISLKFPIIVYLLDPGEIEVLLAFKHSGSTAGLRNRN